MLTSALEGNAQASSTASLAESAAATNLVDRAVEIEYSVFSTSKMVQVYKLTIHKKVRR